MHANGRRLCVAACTALALALFISGATASRSIEMSVAEGELESITAASEAMTLTASAMRITCKVTRLIAIHRRMSKTPGTLAGRVVRFVFSSECEGGEMLFTALHQPRHITYVSFAGTLPNVSSARLRIVGFGVQASVFGGFFRCEYLGDVELTTVGSPIGEFTYDESRSIPLVSGSELCPATARVGGRLRVTPRIRLRLV